MIRRRRAALRPLPVGLLVLAPALAGCPRPASTPISSPTPTPGPEILAADRLRADGKLVPAVEAYGTYSRAHPNDPMPMERIGETLIQNRQYDDAIEALNDAKSLSSRPGRADALLARAVLGQGRIDDALRMAEALHKSNPTETVALDVIAEAHGRRGEPGPQAEALKEILRRAPDDTDAQRKLGRVYLIGQQFADLLPLADALKTREPKLADGFLWSAMARFYLGDDSQLSAAEADAQTAVTLTPGGYRAPLILGRIRRRMKEWPGALDALRVAAERAPKRTDPYLDLAAVYAALGRPGDAAAARKRFADGLAEVARDEALVRSSRRAPKDVALQLRASDAARATGDLRAAAEALGRAAQTAPKDPKVLAAIAAWNGATE